MNVSNDGATVCVDNNKCSVERNSLTCCINDAINNIFSVAVTCGTLYTDCCDDCKTWSSLNDVHSSDRNEVDSVWTGMCCCSDAVGNDGACTECGVGRIETGCWTCGILVAGWKSNCCAVNGNMDVVGMNENCCSTCMVVWHIWKWWVLHTKMCCRWDRHYWYGLLHL